MDLSLAQMFGIAVLGWLEGLATAFGFLKLWDMVRSRSPLPESRSTVPVLVPDTAAMRCGDCGTDMEPDGTDGRGGQKCPGCGKKGLRLRVTRLTEEQEWERERLAEERKAAKEPPGGF